MRQGFADNFFIEGQRVDDDQPIPPSAFMSMDDGDTLQPILHGETIGKTPKDFSKKRSFWIIKFNGKTEIAFDIKRKRNFKVKD